MESNMETKDFYYDLPEELIAQHPLENRESSKLLVLDKATGEIIHKQFSNIIEYLNPGDTLVFNDTRVIPARIFGNRLGKDEKIEFLLLKRVKDRAWESLVKPGKKARVGEVIEFGNGILIGKIQKINDSGTRTIEFKYEGIFEEILDELGEMPLPPYIREKLEDRERYQTVYSKHLGSAAAPTAGLHFTEELIDNIKEKGVNLAYITLHVGLGTFRPVKVDNILEHHMHSEFYNVSEESAKIINRTKLSGGNIISVGTTTTRTLEAIVNSQGLIEAKSGWTDIFIYPGYEFKVIDKQITNFHLPESTLLMLISAFASKDRIMTTYNEAINKGYRFFSFGDAMLIK